MQKTRLRLLQPLIISILITSCSSIPHFTASVMMPAKYDEPTQYRRIAVLPFEGYHGNEIASEIEGIVATVHLNNEPFYTVTESDKTNSVMKQALHSHSGLVNNTTIVDAGNNLGVDGIYLGQVVKPEVYDKDTLEARTKCAYNKTEYTKKGKSYEVCAKYTDYNVNCKDRTAKFTIIPKLIDIKTGKIVYTETIQKEANQSWCEDKGQSVSGDELISVAHKLVLDEFRKSIAPYSEKMDIQLMTDKSGMSGASKSKFESGLEYAKLRKMERACEIWDTLDATEQSATVVYSQGICQEINGNMSDALLKYKAADNIFGKPNEIILSSISRVQKRLDNRKKLRNQVL